MHKIVGCGIFLLKKVIGSPINRQVFRSGCQNVTCQCELMVLVKESAS